MSDFLSLKCANTPNQKYPRGQNVRIPRNCILLTCNKDKHVALQKLSIYYMWKNTRQQCKTNKLKIIAPTWNDEFELPNSFYSVSDMQVYHKHETLTTNPPIYIFINMINNRLVFKRKDGCKLELQTPENMKLIGVTVCHLIGVQNIE